MNTQFITAVRDPFTSEIKMMNLSPLTRGLDQSLTTIYLAYRYVPWFRRACKLRANAIGRFPLVLENERGDDLSEKPEYQPVIQWTRSLLYRVEMNLVKHGAAYHLLESNRFGLNVTPRFIPTALVQPLIDWSGAGLTGFHIGLIGSAGDFPLNRVVYVWEPNDESEVWPGPSDGEAALKASGVLYAIDEMVNRYMGSGGVPVTAVRVPATTPKEEREKVENFLSKLAGGFRNAFKFLTVDKNTEFETIGSEMKDIMSVELTATQRDNVAVAIGVPPTVIDGKSANYATAESEMTGFFMNTIIPEAEMLEPTLNVQLYQRLGVTLRFKPDELEVMQAIQLEQSKGVIELVGKPILSVDEGRAIIEYDPLPGGLGEWKKPEPPPAPPTLPGQVPAGSAASAGSLPEPQPEPAAQMRSWLSQSLALVKAGSPASAGTPFDDELIAASSGNAVRRIYEAHWPRAKSAPPDDLFSRAVNALEHYNALARGSNHDG